MPLDLSHREQLEDEVARILGDGDYYAWTDAELRAALLKAKTPAKPADPVASLRPSRLVWSEPDYTVREGVLWSRRVATDPTGKVHVQDARAHQRVVWEGRSVSAIALARYLSTGSWARGVARPFRAVVRDGARVTHLGYFATREERDAVVLTWKLNRPLR